MGNGGWVLHFVCTVCGTEAEFRGVVRGIAADHAERAGWKFEREELHLAATDRIATCPVH